MLNLLIAGAVAIAVALLVTPLLIRGLQARGIGKTIQDEVTFHAGKAGTPTMGGLIIPVSLLAGYAAAHLVGDPPTGAGLRVVAAILATTIVGIADDWLQVRHERNLGLRNGQKTIAMLAVAVAFAIAHVTQPDSCTRLSFTQCDSLPFDVGPWLFGAFAVGVVWVTSNSTNFTDGLEGLLSGSASVSFAALAAIGFWQFRHPEIYGVDAALDLATISIAMAAACAGFLWWNGSAQTVFMGDSGSLPIGTALAALTISMDIVLLLPVIGALYVIEGVSSPLQIYYFKFTHGRRLFRMAPLHHHFEMLGWSWSTIVVRFWMLSAIAAALGLMIFYADALRSL